MRARVRLAPGEAELTLQKPTRVFGTHPRWRRRVVLALRIVTIVAMSYLIVANVLLRTRLLRNIVSGSDLSFAITGNSTDLLVDYQSAYSILPGGSTWRG